MWISSTFANSLSGWLHESQERGTVAHGPRSECFKISNDDVTRNGNAFQQNPRKFLRFFIAEPGIPFSTVEKVSPEIWIGPRTGCVFCNNSSRKTFLCDWIMHRLFVLDWAIILDAWNKLSSLMNASLISNYVVNKDNAKVWVKIPLLLSKSYQWRQKRLECTKHSYCSLFVFQTIAKWWKLQKNAFLFLHAEDIKFAGVSRFSQQDGAPPHLAFDMRPYLDTKLLQHSTWGSNSVAGKAIRLDCFTFLCWPMWKRMCFLFRYHLYLIQKKGMDQRLQL